MERGPNEALSDLIQKEFKQEYLEAEIKKYQGVYPENLLEYCVKMNPEGILNHLFGVPQLRDIAVRMGIPAAKMIQDKNEQETVCGD